ncbi:hypothetical protein [Pseudomonas aeruginosa]|nr:hypothetical protein [Pseudomonas aeruginosa]MDF5869998.1 hypothetical protein [Pseudomonas aeruginosa]
MELDVKIGRSVLFQLRQEPRRCLFIHGTLEVQIGIVPVNFLRLSVKRWNWPSPDPAHPDRLAEWRSELIQLARAALKRKGPV